MLKENRVQLGHRLNLFDRHLYWAALHPILFSMEIMVLCAWSALALWPTLTQTLTAWGWAFPPAHENWTKGAVDVGAFLGVPWTVQATLVALVYPLVLSFIAVFLQRRAKAEVMLRIYMFDSGILPAGASSLALLAMLSVAYFATPVIAHDWADTYARLLFAGAVWFLINLFLTALFLARTLHYLQSAEQMKSLRRAAIGVIYPAEIRQSLRQALVYRELAAVSPPRPSRGEREPSVSWIVARTDGLSSVTKKLGAGDYLVEVLLPVLRLAATLWLRRARRHPDAARACLYIAGYVGIVRGIQRLAAVEVGPELSMMEKGLIRLAFWHRRSPSNLLNMANSALMSELAKASVAAANEGHLDDAVEGVGEVRVLISDLINSGRFVSSAGDDNTALLPDPRYRWSERMFPWGWVKTFEPLHRLAIETATQSPALFRALAQVSPQLMRDVERPIFAFAAPLMSVFEVLDGRLSEWWQRHAVVNESNLAAVPHLPEGSKKQYADLLAIMVGAWTHILPSSERRATGSDAESWFREATLAHLRITHMESTAGLLLRAVARADLMAAKRYCDLFLKWLNFELGLRRLGTMEYEDRYRAVGINVLYQPWEDVRIHLGRDGEPASLAEAMEAAHISLKRFFEARRLQMVLMMLDALPAADSDWTARDAVAVEIITALVRGKALHGGGTVDVASFSTLQEIFARLIHGAFIDEMSRGMLELRAGQAYQDEHSPDVEGWPFGGSLPRFGLTATRRGWARLLGMLAMSVHSIPQSEVRDASDLMAWLWRSPEELQAAADFFAGLGTELNPERWEADASESRVVNRLRAAVGATALTNEELTSTQRACVELSTTASWYRSWTIKRAEVTNEHKSAFLTGVSEGAFAADPDRLRSTSPVVKRTTTARPFVFTVPIPRERLTNSISSARSEGVALGRYLRPYIDSQAMRDVLVRLELEPVQEPTWTSGLFDPAPDTDFINALGQKVQIARSQGQDPAVVLWSGRASGALHRSTIREHLGHAPLDIDHVVGSADVEGHQSITVDGAPVLQRLTPGGACYVIPRKLMEVLAVQKGVYNGVWLEAAWADDQDDPLAVRIELSLIAEYGPSVAEA